MPQYSEEVLKALEGTDEKAYVAAFDDIVRETAKWLCPTEVEIAAGTPDVDYDAFQNREVYKNFCELLVKKFNILGTNIMIDEYRRGLWKKMGRTGEPPEDWTGDDSDKTEGPEEPDENDDHSHGEKSKDQGEGPVESPGKKKKRPVHLRVGWVSRDIILIIIIMLFSTKLMIRSCPFYAFSEIFLLQVKYSIARKEDYEKGK